MVATPAPRSRRPLAVWIAIVLAVAGLAGAAWWVSVELSRAPPEVSGLSASVAYEDELFSYLPNATQAGEWHLATNATWLSVDEETGELSGTPPAAGASYYANLTLTNENGIAAFNLTIATKLRLTDDRGREVILDRPAQRVISLAASNTELVFALGAGERVVGTAAVWGYPPEAANLPVVVTLNNLNLDLIVYLEPDLILAAGITSPDQLSQLEGLGLRTLVLDPRNLTQVVENIALVGQAMGAKATAEALIANFTATWEEVRHALASIATSPRTFYLLDSWGGYWTAGAGTFIDELIREAKGANIAADIPGWFILSSENITASTPEVLILGAYVMLDESTLASDPFWGQLPAVQQGRVYRITDQNLFDRPGPRLVQGLEILAHWLHPEAYAGP